ncbi:MAG: hypothetical protein JWO62_1035 [Acidimicrobiaceae bacterium]|nr:hypothetical protein [Acidimicrobiaceae bacterium]
MVLSDVRPGLEQRKSVRVLVDEAHQEAWSVRPELSAAMRPEHPGDASYAGAAVLLDDRDFVVTVNSGEPLTGEVLSGADVLVVAHPSDPKWERTTGSGRALLGPDELDAVRTFVERGGGLVVLGETEQDKYGNNLNELLAAFGLRIEHATVYDYVAYHKTESWVLGSVVSLREAGFFPQARQAYFYRTGVVSADGEHSWLGAFTSSTADPPRAGLLGLARYGAGRVAVFADSDLFGDDCLAEHDHVRLWLDTLYWVSASAFSAPVLASGSFSTDESWWASLSEVVSELRELEDGDGSIDLSRHDAEACRSLVQAVAEAIGVASDRFPHQRGYLEAVVEDLEQWVRAGFVKPDFARSLAAFHPERSRADGTRFLVVFPMYTPNASLETRFEALVVEVPWPGWIASLEKTHFENPKFVPVHLLDATAGYDGECAVLFPETVSASPPAPNDFGAIFCDREASRLHKVVRAATPILGLELPPEVQALFASEALLRDTFLLWDLVHDRAHSHGDLPFDPFMVRQRLPYWMYSLEELRCDLTAFHEAGLLAARELPFARYVQYAVLFDRILRFPVTGSRVRNYDGLGGQILFGFLHREGVVRWTDNQLRVRWEQLEVATERLRKEVEELYRAGIDMTRVSYWLAAHDLVAKYVKPNLASRWVSERGAAMDESDPRAWIAKVDDDEFPLSIFYRNLRQKLVAAGALASA